MFRRILLHSGRTRSLASPSMMASTAFTLATFATTKHRWVSAFDLERRGTVSEARHQSPPCPLPNAEKAKTVPTTLQEQDASPSKKRDPAPVGPFRVRVRDLVGPLVSYHQEYRMPKFDQEVEVYSSDERQKLWSALGEKLREMDGTHEKPQIGVTGITGCGKSHALLWWAKQQMDRGHLVLYVQNAEHFARPDWGRRIYDILHQAAMNLWNLRGLNGNALKKIFPNSCPAVDQLEEVWTRLSNAVIPRLIRKGATQLQIKTLHSMLEDAPTDAPILYSKFLRSLITQVIAVSNRPEGSFTHSIFIVDQDNRLKKAVAEKKSPYAVSANTFISASPCSLTVLCASANNEGWERVDLRMIHLYPEPVPMRWMGLPHLLPLDVLIKILKPKPGSVETIADAIAAFPAFFKKLEELTNFYPLELRFFSDFCVRLGSRGVGWESILEQFEAQRGTEVRAEMARFISDRSDRLFAMLTVLKGQTSVDGPEVDRRYVTKAGESKNQEFVTPIAWRAAREVLQTAFAAIDVEPSSEPGRGFWYESKVSKLCEQRDFLRRNRSDSRSVDLCTNPASLFRVEPDPTVLYYVPPTHPDQRAFDFTLITGTQEVDANGRRVRRFCVVFVQCCRGFRHKDSFSDLVVNGDRYWQQMLPLEKCYLGYLWITPNLPKVDARGVELQQPDEDNLSKVKLKLGERTVSFAPSGPRWKAWSTVFDSTTFVIGRPARSVAPSHFSHPWKDALAFDEMHRDYYPQKSLSEPFTSS
jgi:hypothetical protein